jgi:hypothetical protein
MHEKRWSENAKQRHALPTGVNNTKLEIKIRRLIIYTELDFLRVGSSDWVLWALKPESYINLGNSLTSSVSQIFQEDRSSRILRVDDKTFPEKETLLQQKRGDKERETFINEELKELYSLLNYFQIHEAKGTKIDSF